MVLNDITNDYSQFITLLNRYSSENSYIISALHFIDTYHNKINTLADTFLKSSKNEHDKNALYAGLNSLETAFSSHIASMNSSIRNTTRLITEIEQINFTSSSVKNNAKTLCQSLNCLMSITEEYVEKKLRGLSNTATFFKLITELDNFKKVHVQIHSNNIILENIEQELLEELPFEFTEETKFYQLDIRSYKQELNIISFTDDLKLLADCLQHLERLVSPLDGNNIYIRKIESGSLKALLESDKVDFSIFPDLIKSITNAIKTCKLLPLEKELKQAEIKKTNAETELLETEIEEKRIANVGSKLLIANQQIDYLCDKLNLDPKNPEHQEQIQHFCLPLITYIEHNPLGTINGFSYDVTREVHLLEDSQSK